MSGFRRVSERVVHEGAVVTFAVGTFEGPDGTTFQRDVVRHPGAVSVVAVDDDGSVVLVRQYRAPLDEEILELPAGKLDGEEQGWCRVMKDGASCFAALDGAAQDACRAGSFPEDHVFWKQCAEQ